MNEQATIETTEQKTPRKKRTRGTKIASQEIDERIKKLKCENGLTISEIGTIVDLDPSNVFRRIQRILPEKQAREQFEKDKSAHSQKFQADVIEVTGAVMEALKEDVRNGRIAQLDPPKKVVVVERLQLATGINETKQRERDGKLNNSINVFNTVVLQAAAGSASIATPGNSTESEVNVSIHNPKVLEHNPGSECIQGVASTE